LGRLALTDVCSWGYSLSEELEPIMDRTQAGSGLPRFRQTSVPVTLVYVNALAAGLAAALHAGTFGDLRAVRVCEIASPLL